MSSVVYLGTSSYAAIVLEHLGKSQHRPKLVITLPDRRQGRGRKLSPPPVAAVARELGLDLAQPDSINSEQARKEVDGAKPDVVCVCAYGQFIKEPLLSDYLMLNVHPSLLPRWRGAAPIERSLMAGDTETGVTIMRLNEGLDSGPVVLTQAIDVGPESNYGWLSAQLADLGGALLIESLDKFDSGGLSYLQQDDARATYAEKIEPADRRLDLALPARRVVNQVRALSPHIGAYLEDESGKRIKILAATVAKGRADPGEVITEGERLLVGCGDGLVDVLELQPAGRSLMPASAYLLGHRSLKKFV